MLFAIGLIIVSIFVKIWNLNDSNLNTKYMEEIESNYEINDEINTMSCEQQIKQLIRKVNSSGLSELERKLKVLVDKMEQTTKDDAIMKPIISYLASTITSLSIATHKIGVHKVTQLDVYQKTIKLVDDLCQAVESELISEVMESLSDASSSVAAVDKMLQVKGYVDDTYKINSIK